MNSSGSSRTYGYNADTGDIPPTAPGYHQRGDEETCPINRGEKYHDLPSVEQIRHEASINHGFKSLSVSSSSTAPNRQRDDLYRTTYDTSKYQESRARRRMVLLLICAAVIVMVTGFGLGLAAATGWRPSSDSYSTTSAAESNNYNNNGSDGAVGNDVDTNGDGIPDTPTTEVAPDESRKQAILSFLSVRISHSEDFEAPDTPQNKALLWMTTDPYYPNIPTDPGNYDSSYRFVQRYIMVVFYYAMGGEAWLNQCDFLNTESSVCNWNFLLPPTDDQKGYTYGVQCNSDEEITDILLSGNNLKGQFPEEIGDLLALNHLSLFDNEVSGWLPKRMQSLSDMWFLQLQKNQLSGAIPSWISKLTSLQYLGLKENAFTGTIPYTFFNNASALLEIDFSYNLLTGPIEVFDGETCPPDLKVLYLSNNQLTGRIHDLSFSSCDSLFELDMSVNQLTGYFPKSFYSYDIIDLHDNMLSGRMSSVTSNDSGMVFLSLANNNLSSTIPESIIDLQYLRHLDLSNNVLSGALSDTLLDGAMEIEYLILSNNNFTAGPIPNLAAAKGLLALGLAGTNRDGMIPTWLGSLPRLQLLDLHSNKLNGTIPTQLGLLNDLDYLLLNRNELIGDVPSSLTTMKDAQALYLDNNGLTGSLDFLCDAIEDNNQYLRLFTSDCYKGKEIKCKCCSTCCMYNDELCNNAPSDKFMTISYNNDHYIYRDNFDFDRPEPST